MSIFEQPIIGPFVEQNGIADNRNTGASLTWTSAGAVYRLDLIRKGRTPWYDTLEFTQIPDLDFDDFLWHMFENNSRLPDFLNELLPFFRPSSGAPSPADAGRWLHPDLVAKGFSLGNAKHLTNGAIRIPVIWVYGGNANAYGSKEKYARLDFIDWTPSEIKLVHHYYYWGTGAKALRRFLYQSVETLSGPLLTDAGQARMQQLLSWRRPKTQTAGRRIMSQTEKATADRCRNALNESAESLSSDFKNDISSISEKAYAGVLRTCIQRNLPQSARTLLFYRPLPNLGKNRLLERIVDAGWLNIWDVCSKDAFSDLMESRSGFHGLLVRVVDSGNVKLLKAVLSSLPEMSVPVAAFLLEHSIDLGRADLFASLLEARVMSSVRDEALLLIFRNCLSYGESRQRVAIYLLEIGVRPIVAFVPDMILQPCYNIIDNRNLKVLKRALEFEPPTHDILRMLLTQCGCISPGDSFDFLCSASRALPRHKERMDEMAIKTAQIFICSGQRENLSVLTQAFNEGGDLQEIAQPISEQDDLLRGHKWRERQGNWIDLIGYLNKTRRIHDMEAVKRLKRNSERKSR